MSFESSEGYNRLISLFTDFLMMSETSPSRIVLLNNNKSHLVRAKFKVFHWYSDTEIASNIKRGALRVTSMCNEELGLLKIVHVKEDGKDESTKISYEPSDRVSVKCTHEFAAAAYFFDTIRDSLDFPDGIEFNYYHDTTSGFEPDTLLNIG
jgi:hypothetical protein